MPLRVVVVEDHRLVAEGLAALLANEPDITVAGVAVDVDAAIALIRRSAPDVVICDIQLGDESGFSVLEQGGREGVAFVMYSSHDHPSYAKAALDGGALGFVLKGAPSDELIAAVRAAGRGWASYAAEALRSARSGRRLPTSRQLEIIEGLAAGWSNDEIALRLGVAPKTVESHLRTLFDRQGVGTRTELVLSAIAEGWIRERRSRPGRGRPGGARGGWFAERGLSAGHDAGGDRRGDRGDGSLDRGVG